MATTFPAGLIASITCYNIYLGGNCTERAASYAGTALDTFLFIDLTDPVSGSIVIASTGHARRHGRISSAIALYGHA